VQCSAVQCSVWCRRADKPRVILVQNPDKESTFFDLKWVLKSNDIKHRELLDHQLANHFSKASNITTKASRVSLSSAVHCGADTSS
jgi:hypothetical protein